MLFSCIISLTLFALISCSNNDNACFNLQLSISQKIENDGFHRDINWLIESLDLDIEQWNNLKCRVSLLLDVPPEMFVDPDQIADLNRNGLLAAYIEGKVNVETPAHESQGHKVQIFLSSNLEKVAVVLPIHLRYQRAMIAGGFGKTTLPKPSVLLHCPVEKLHLCESYEQVNATCNMTSSSVCSWSNISYQALFDEAQLLVPIGNLDDYPIVAVVTLLLGCVGSIYILSLLSMAPI